MWAGNRRARQFASRPLGSGANSGASDLKRTGVWDHPEMIVTLHTDKLSTLRTERLCLGWVSLAPDNGLPADGDTILVFP